MTNQHTQSALLTRVSTATFADHPRRAAMLAFGIDGDPQEDPAPQALISPGYTINCYFNGGGELVDHTGRHRIEAGTVVLRIPGVEQRVTHDRRPRYAKGWCGMSIQQGEALVALGLLSHEQTCWSCSDLDAALRILDRLIDDCRSWPKPVGPRLWRRIIEWIEALQPQRVGSDPIARSAELLLLDLTCSQDLPAIASQVGMAYGTFRRQFHQRFGMSPAAWRLQERMRQACSLLDGSAVSEVAEQLGYRSPFAFSTQFSRSMGMSPRAWKKRLRGG